MLKILLIFFTFSSLAKRVVVPPPADINDKRKGYFYEVIEVALKKTNSNYRLKYYPTEMNQVRALKSLQTKSIDLMWTMQTPKRDKEALAIKIPLLNNLLGFRVCLVKKGRKDFVSQMVSKNGLAGLKYVQGLGWPDVTYLEKSKLKVIKSSYKYLFNLIRIERGDCFLRSILEVDNELKNPEFGKGIEVENSFAIKYDAPMFFYFNKENIDFKNGFEKALTRMKESGELDKIFNKHYGGILERYNYSGRRVFELK